MTHDEQRAAQRAERARDAIDAEHYGELLAYALTYGDDQ